MANEVFLNQASCQLASPYTTGAGSITVTGATYGTGFGQFPSSLTGGQFFRINVGSVVMKVTAINAGTNVWTVTVIESVDSNLAQGTTVKAVLSAGGAAGFHQVGSADLTDADVVAANKDGTAATPSLRTLGTGATQAAAGNDPRLSDNRTDASAFHKTGDAFGANATLGTGDDYDLILETDGVERARITAAGDVTVGLASNSGSSMWLCASYDLNYSLNPGLALLASPDGLRWNSLRSANKPLYVPASGGMYDPSIMRYNGQYWLVHDHGGATQTDFAVVSSPDLENWTQVATVSCTGLAGVQQVWAPEWFVDADGSVHVVVALNTTTNGVTGFGLYELHPTNTAMTAWSAPTAITGTNFPATMIDPFLMLNPAGGYMLWYKNQVSNTGTIEYATSTSLTSGYTVQKSGDWAGWGTSKEGPCPVYMGGTHWRVYMFQYTGTQGIFSSDSTDNMATWSAITALDTPFTIDHGTMIRLTDIGSLRSVAAVALAGTRTCRAALLKGGSSVAVGAGATAALTLGTVAFDSGGFTGPNVASGSVLCRDAGLYQITVTVNWQSTSAYQLEVHLKDHTGTVIGTRYIDQVNQWSDMSYTFNVVAAAGEVYSFEVKNDGAGSGTVGTDSTILINKLA